MRVSQSSIDRFNGKWQLNTVNGCWEWTGSLTTQGYGQIKKERERRQMPAHRLSYLIHRGSVPEGKCVLHKCDNRKCVNPDHLFIGTKLDNSRDMVAKGRDLHGERQCNARFTEADILKVYDLCFAGMKKVRIAEIMKCHPVYISQIWRGDKWRYLKQKWITSNALSGPSPVLRFTSEREAFGT